MKWGIIIVLVIFSLFDGASIADLKQRVAALEAQISANPNTIGD